MKKLILTVSAVLVICMAAAGCGKKAEPQATQKPAAEIERTSEPVLGWDNIQDGFDEVWKFADEIFIGKVESHEYYEENGLPSTAVTVTIENSMRGDDKGETRVISYSGGELNGELYTSTSVVVPSDGEEYLFLIEPEMEGDEYKYPCGGYQGTYKVSGNTSDSVIEKFNENNVLESEILGEKVSKLPYGTRE